MRTNSISLNEPVASMLQVLRLIIVALVVTMMRDHVVSSTLSIAMAYGSYESE